MSTCPDCGKPDAVTFGDGGCLTRCPELAFRSVTRCRIDTIARLKLELERTWEDGYGSGWSDARFAKWGTHPNPHSSTETVLAKQSKAREARRESRTWYVHVKEPSNDSSNSDSNATWAPTDGGPWTRAEAVLFAAQLRSEGKVAGVGTDPKGPSA